MPKFRNVSPLGDLDVPFLGRVVESGEVIDLPAERAVFIAHQAENWEPVDAEATALAAPTPTEDQERPVDPPVTDQPAQIDSSDGGQKA